MSRKVLSCSVALAALMVSHFALAIEPQAYMSSIIKSAVHQPGQAPKSLVTIQGQHIRMVTFTNYGGYKTTDSKLGASIWTTVDPELKQRCSEFVKQHHPTHQQLTTWLAQMLGVPLKQSETRRFVMLDVPVIQAYYGSSPQNIGIFRPCTDPRIGPHPDPICPPLMNPNDSQIASAYKTWFINNSIGSHTLTDGAGAPWTEYGYTYNWNPEAENVYGASEFIVLKDTPINVIPNPYDSSNAYMSAEEYCR